MGREKPRKRKRIRNCNMNGTPNPDFDPTVSRMEKERLLEQLRKPNDKYVIKVSTGEVMSFSYRDKVSVAHVLRGLLDRGEDLEFTVTCPVDKDMVMSKLAFNSLNETMNDPNTSDDVKRDIIEKIATNLEKNAKK